MMYVSSVNDTKAGLGNSVEKQKKIHVALNAQTHSSILAWKKSMDRSLGYSPWCNEELDN